MCRVPLPLTALLCLALAVCCAGVVPVLAESSPCLPDNLRPDAPWIGEVLCRHLPRSATLRRLRDRIATAPVVVYLHDALSSGDGVEGRLRFIGGAGGWCYLRIDLHRQRDDVQSAALLAHELQHVVEVAEAGVTDHASWLALYEGIGIQAIGSRTAEVDTASAIVAGAVTLRELTGRVPLIPAFALRAIRASGLAPGQ